MTMSVGQLLNRRRVQKAPPMAVPLDLGAREPLSERFAAWAHRAVTRRLSVASQRVLSWVLFALCIGVIGVAYLVQTSYVASLANQSARLESTTTAVQDANARLTAHVAEARAIGKAEPAAREQGLRVAGANTVAYLTMPDAPDPTALPTALPTMTPGVRERAGAVLLGSASVDASAPLPAGSAATAEATMRPASLGGISPATPQPVRTPAGGKP